MNFKTTGLVILFSSLSLLSSPVFAACTADLEVGNDVVNYTGDTEYFGMPGGVAMNLTGMPGRILFSGTGSGGVNTITFTADPGFNAMVIAKNNSANGNDTIIQNTTTTESWTLRKQIGGAAAVIICDNGNGNPGSAICSISGSLE